MLKINPVLNTDSYKLSHHLYYPEGVSFVSSYAESRGGRYPETLMFGLKMIIQDELMVPFTKEDIEEAEQEAKLHGDPFCKDGFEYILNKYGGYFPVHIRGIPEGTMVPTNNLLVRVDSNDPKVPWVNSHIETSLVRLWYPITVATRVFNMRKIIKKYFDETSDTGNMDFALLDFSARGCSSYESSVRGPASFLTCFKGSDSLSATRYMNRVYGSTMSSFSIPATEHSVMTAYGKENEFESFKNILMRTPEGTSVSVVSDTWDIFNACEYWVQLTDLVKQRNITLVVRPDSGEIEGVLPKILEILSEGFGWDINYKGYKVLKNLKVLWGDGIDESNCHIPFEIAKKMGISSDSVLVASGGGLMQNDINRDTTKFAFKASGMDINGEFKPIAKDPITDQGKRSKTGLLDLVKDQSGQYKTVDMTLLIENKQYLWNSQLVGYYYNGEMLYDESLEDIRARVNSYFK